LEVPLTERRPLLEKLAAGRLLQGHWRGFGSYQNWLDIRARYLLPRLQSGLHFLYNWQISPPEASEWIKAYVDRVEIVFAAVDAFYRELAHNLAGNIQKKVAEIDPEWAGEKLSQTAVRVLRSTAGVSCVLVGMRRRPYVDDVLAELGRPVDQKPRTKAWAALKQQQLLD